ncbi:hypothetical protein D3C85_1206250 [compost metagenome]
MLLFVEPQGDADRRQQLFGLLALLGAHFTRGVQAAHALTQQRRGVGHAAHDRLGAEPAGHAGAGDPGRNRHHQLIRRKAWAQGFTHGFHGLGLDRQHHHVSTLDGVSVVGKYVDAVLGIHPCTGFGAGIAGADPGGIQTFGAQAANQAGGHVAGTNKGNTSLAHDRSL